MSGNSGPLAIALTSTQGQYSAGFSGDQACA
jgi:hypothetical protein